MQVEKNYSPLISPAYGTPGIRETADRIAKSGDSMNRERRKQPEQPTNTSQSGQGLVATIATESPQYESRSPNILALDITV